MTCRYRSGLSLFCHATSVMRTKERGRGAFMEICDRNEKRPDGRKKSADYLWLTILWSIFKIVNTIFQWLSSRLYGKLFSFSFTRGHHVDDCSECKIFSRRAFVYAVVFCFSVVLVVLFISRILWQRRLPWDHWRRYCECSKWTDLIVASIHRSIDARKSL